MNRPIPKLGSVKNPGEISEKFLQDYSHLAIPAISVQNDEKTEVQLDFSARSIKTLEKIFGITFKEEIFKLANSANLKAGDVIEIPIVQAKSKIVKILLVGVGSRTDFDIRKAATAVGRKVRGIRADILSFILNIDIKSTVKPKLNVITFLSTHVFSPNFNHH